MVPSRTTVSTVGVAVSPRAVLQALLPVPEPSVRAAEPRTPPGTRGRTQTPPKPPSGPEAGPEAGPGPPHRPSPALRVLAKLGPAAAP